MPRKQVSYDYIMPLFYFKTDCCPLKISQDIKIRKMDTLELIYLEEDTLPAILSDVEIQSVSCVLERTSKSALLLNETYELFEQVITAFRLLKPGPIYSKVLYMVKPTGHNIVRWASKRIPIHLGYYVFGKDDLKRLRKLLRRLENLRESKGANESLSVALRFFEKSFEDDWESAIVSCWTAFEALCFGGERPGEGVIGPTVKIAVSMLLGMSRKERGQIKSFLAGAYQERNDIVHGNRRKSRDDVDTVGELQNYLRMAIAKLLD